MQGETQIVFGMTVNEVMRRWPATIRIFLDFRMSCVGCPIAGFHTVADTCREHAVALEDFLSGLRVAACAANGSAGRRAFGNAEEAVRIADGDALPPALDEAELFPRA
jgi:hybrid cluster-associated redox disulfide protein